MVFGTLNLLYWLVGADLEKKPKEICVCLLVYLILYYRGFLLLTLSNSLTNECNY